MDAAVFQDHMYKNRLKRGELVGQVFGDGDLVDHTHGRAPELPLPFKHLPVAFELLRIEIWGSRVDKTVGALGTGSQPQRLLVAAP